MCCKQAYSTTILGARACCCGESWKGNFLDANGRHEANDGVGVDGDRGRVVGYFGILGATRRVYICIG